MAHWSEVRGQRSVFTWKHLRQSEEGRVICHEAGGEDESCVLLVELGQLLLQRHVVVTSAGDVPGAPRSCTVLLQGITKITQDARWIHVARSSPSFYFKYPFKFSL